MKRSSFQQPIVDRIKEVLVWNEKQLIEAIGKLVIENTKFPGAAKGYFPGKIIKIAEPFTLTQPVDLPAACFGLIIDGCNTSLSPAIDGMTAFIINGTFVKLKNIILGGGDSVATEFFGKLVEIKGFADNCEIENCLITGKTLVDATSASSCDDLQIKFCRTQRTGTADWINLANSVRAIIVGNRFDGSSIDTAITLGSGCSNALITSNFLDGCNITTSASDGGNIISANSRDSSPGTYTLHATDIIWPNSRTDGNPGDVWTYSADGSPPSWQAPSGGAGSANAEEITLDFGTDGGTTLVSGTISCSWITSAKKLSYSVIGVSRDAEDAALEQLHVSFGNIVANTSFDVFLHAPEGSTGQYTVQVTGV